MQKKLVRAALLAGLFIQGLSLGCLWMVLSNPSSAPSEEQSVTVPTPHTDPTLPIYGSQQHRQIAEKLILGDNPAQAIPHLLNAAPNQIEQSDDGLLFRIALCLESNMEIQNAAGFYERILNRATNEPLIAASRLGLARCRLRMNEPDRARQLLWRNYLLFDNDPLGEFNNEALFLLARSFGGADRYQSALLLKRGQLIENIQPRLNISRQLLLVIDAAKVDSVPAVSIPPEPNPEQPAQVEADTESDPGQSTRQPIRIDNIIKADEGPENVFASFFTTQTDLVTLFQWMSTKFDMRLEITDRGRQLAAQQVISLHMNHVSVATALDAQTLPFGLGWKVSDGSIAIFSLDEAPDDVLAAIRQNSAFRILERVLIVAPDHMQTDYARFRLAGLHHRLGNPVQAVALYSELLGERLDPSLRQAVNFNQGQIQTILEDGSGAIESYSRVVDSNEGGDIQAVAYIHTGQIFLGLGKHDEASAAFSRAFRTGNASMVRQMAKLGIASGYMLAHNDRLAIRELSDMSLFQNPDKRRVAEFLVALGTLRTMEDGQAYDERTELLSTLSSLQWSPELGEHFRLLMAIGYEELGFTNQTIQILEDALERSIGSWLRLKLVDQLTTLLVQAGRVEEARSALMNAMEFPRLGDGGMLLFRFATIEYQARNKEACLQYCRELLSRDQAADYHADALVLMGRIFEERGEHYQAALCFSGVLPGAEHDQEGYQQ